MTKPRAFEALAEFPALDEATVYAEGWQSWSPAGVYGVDGRSPRPPDELRRTMGWRSGKPEPERGIQAEGILVLAGPDGARAWFAPRPEREVASLRLERRGNRVVVSTDGLVEELRAASLDEALAELGVRLSAGTTRAVGPGWCSWSAYFGAVTEADVVENLEVAEQLELPLEIVQVDDGYETCVGDWLEQRPSFGSLRRLADRIAAVGRRPGIWTAPFLVGERSALAAAHPDWLVEDVDAGWNWQQRLRVLDVTHPAAAEHLQQVFRSLRDWGFAFHKLDFLYAGALDGRRHADVSPLEAYRVGLRLVRDAAGPDAILVGCGAPLLPSIGLVDAMRIGPDVLPESPHEQPDLARVMRATAARAWMNRRLWLNDPDCLVARPEIAEREDWAEHLAGYGGLAFSSDPLAALDARGLALTRALLSRRPARP